MIDENYSDRTWEYIEMGPEKALPLLQGQAEAGDAIARYSLQFMYGKGECLRENPRLANYWLGELTKLAEGGDGQAQFILYEMYFGGAAYGQWVQQNIERGFHWLCKSAESGAAPAQYNLSCRYRTGDPPWIEKDLERAEFFLREAAKQEYPEALYVLATTLVDDYTPPNEEVMRLLNLAAQKKYPPAIKMLRHLKN